MKWKYFLCSYGRMRKYPPKETVMNITCNLLAHHWVVLHLKHGAFKLGQNISTTQLSPSWDYLHFKFIIIHQLFTKILMIHIDYRNIMSLNCSSALTDEIVGLADVVVPHGHLQGLLGEVCIFYVVTELLQNKERHRTAAFTLISATTQESKHCCTVSGY